MAAARRAQHAPEQQFGQECTQSKIAIVLRLLLVVPPPVLSLLLPRAVETQ